jgi:serine/threonine protein kinase
VSSTSIGYLGPYRLLNVVYNGRTTVVWQAHHDGIKQFFAIKTLMRDFLRDRQEVAYLKWEYTVAGRIEEEQLVRVHDFQANRGAPYLAIEWFPAPNMKQRIRSGFAAYGHTVPRTLIEATEALAQLHKHGWVHRDVKPENFLVADDGQVKLIDFGLAQRPKKGLARLFARKSKIQGTKSYMSPEQIRGRPVDARSDLYSLACTFFELITGRPPFTGVSVQDLLLKHVKSSPPSLRALDRNITQELADLIRYAMAKQPAQRPESVENFLGRLKALRPFHTPPPAAVHRLNGPALQSPHPPAESPP